MTHDYDYKAVLDFILALEEGPNGLDIYNAENIIDTYIEEIKSALQLAIDSGDAVLCRKVERRVSEDEHSYIAAVYYEPIQPPEASE